MSINLRYGQFSKYGIPLESDSAMNLKYQTNCITSIISAEHYNQRMMFHLNVIQYLIFL